MGGRFHDLRQSVRWGHKYNIVVVDYFTKWEEEIPTFKVDGERTTYFIFNQIITRFGILKHIVTGHGC